MKLSLYLSMPTSRDFGLSLCVIFFSITKSILGTQDRRQSYVSADTVGLWEVVIANEVSCNPTRQFTVCSVTRLRELLHLVPKIFEDLFLADV